jgi:lysophospholipase L1-like esterase
LRTSALIVAILAAVSTACNGSLYHPTHAPRLAATNFLAFGDSITYGASDACSPNATRLTMSQSMSMAVLMAEPPMAGSYPAVLQTLLRDEYPMQNATVSESGIGGELLSEGVRRLPGELLQVAPQVTLIVEGANDVNQSTSMAQIATSLGTMIQQARSRGNTVFVATVPPQRQGACRGFNPAGVAPANEQIRATARAEGAVVVDIYEAFGGVPDPYVGRDGLHPNAEGYARIAQAFFDAISAKLRD